MRGAATRTPKGYDMAEIPVKPRRSARKWKLAGAAVSVLLLAAHIFTNLPMHLDGAAVHVAGPNLYELNLEDLVKARTTKNELVRALGEPLCIRHDGNRELMVFLSVLQQTSGTGKILYTEYFHVTHAKLATVTLVDGFVIGMETASESYIGQAPDDLVFECDLPQAQTQ